MLPDEPEPVLPVLPDELLAELPEPLPDELEPVLPDELPVLPDEPEPELLPEALEEPPRSIEVLPAPSSSTSSFEPLLPELEVSSPRSTLVLPVDEEESSSALSSLLSEELPPSRLENVYPADAANVSAAVLLYPVITSGDQPDCDPMEVTERGIVIERIPLPEKAPLSIVVRPFGSVKDVTLLHPASAPLPIIFVAELSATLDFPTGTIISLVLDAL